jgi:hypothetical protein
LLRVDLENSFGFRHRGIVTRRELTPAA